MEKTKKLQPYSQHKQSSCESFMSYFYSEIIVNSLRQQALELLFSAHIVQVKVKQTGIIVFVIFVEWDETVLQIKRYSISISINSEETASCFVIHDEMTLDEVKQEKSYVFSFHRLIHSKTANLCSWITLDALGIDKSFPKTIILCLGIKIRHRNTVIQQTEESGYTMDIFLVKKCVGNR